MYNENAGEEARELGHQLEGAAMRIRELESQLNSDKIAAERQLEEKWDEVMVLEGENRRLKERTSHLDRSDHAGSQVASLRESERFYGHANTLPANNPFMKDPYGNPGLNPTNLENSDHQLQQLTAKNFELEHKIRDLQKHQPNGMFQTVPHLPKNFPAREPAPFEIIRPRIERSQ
jgi:hypothetical protein